jgi:hypothetical protein
VENQKDGSATALELARLIRPMLAPYSPEVRSGALADLMALNLAGFQGPDKGKLRRELLRLHLDTILELIPANEAMLLGENGHERRHERRRPRDPRKR